MGKGSDVKECNVTHADQRWRDYVRKEDNTKKTWQYKWGFLADHYKEVCEYTVTSLGKLFYKYNLADSLCM